MFVPRLVMNNLELGVPLRLATVAVSDGLRHSNVAVKVLAACTLRCHQTWLENILEKKVLMWKINENALEKTVLMTKSL